MEAVKEPMAWWIVATLFGMMLIFVGVLLKIMYSGITRRLDGLEVLLATISNFMSKQDEKNQQFAQLWQKMDKQKDEINTSVDKKEKDIRKELEKQSIDIWNEFEKNDLKFGRLSEEVAHIATVQRACPHKPLV